MGLPGKKTEVERVVYWECPPRGREGEQQQQPQAEGELNWAEEELNWAAMVRNQELIP